MTHDRLHKKAVEAFQNKPFSEAIDAVIAVALKERCPVDALDCGMTPVEAAVWHVWGERCSDFEPTCLTCQAWAEFDKIKRDA